MRGYERNNFDAFEEAAWDLREAGWQVFSPAENDIANGWTDDQGTLQEGAPTHVRFFMADDLRAVALCDAVFFLEGWEDSEGATLEHDVAQRLGRPCYIYDNLDLIPYNSATSVIKKTPRESFGSTDFGPGERKTHPATGGSKGWREATMSLVPIYPRVQEARVHGFAVSKYPDADIARPNWTLGVPFSWFADAQERHYLSWLAGESFDVESGLHNLAHARWMLAALMELERKIYLGEIDETLDDRRRQ